MKKDNEAENECPFVRRKESSHFGSYALSGDDQISYECSIDGGIARGGNRREVVPFGASTPCSMEYAKDCLHYMNEGHKIIGMIHLDALSGYPQHRGMDRVIKNALHDAVELEKGGVDSILIENTDDDPHQKVLGPEQIAAYTLAAQKIAENTNLPLGICCLFNDYKTALSIAKIVGAEFVRVPVFNEAVISSSGIIEADPYDVIVFRDKINANHIKILADVQVKHAYSLSRRPIQESAAEILHFKADELVITGRFTGDMPALEDLKAVREALPDSHINIGSGTTPDNVKTLTEYANAVIVGTYFKVDGRMNAEKVKELRKAIE